MALLTFVTFLDLFHQTRGGSRLPAPCSRPVMLTGYQRCTYFLYRTSSDLFSSQRTVVVSGGTALLLTGGTVRANAATVQ